ncbi:MAG: hypothetical protein FJ134_17265 [Deltaproteobacteria bacterium]|nr:hypothetical protein [Deltaproteobacteria bacterium]
MPDVIDVSGLDEKDIELLQLLAEKLRTRAQRGQEEAKAAEQEKELVFATHPSDVIGPLTREEIYEDL